MYGVLMWKDFHFVTMMKPIRECYSTAQGAGHGDKSVFLRTVDTDVISHHSCCKSLLLVVCNNLWIAFDAGKAFSYVDTTAIVFSLGDDRCEVLLAFYAVTGSDTTYCFLGRSKRKCLVSLECTKQSYTRFMHAWTNTISTQH